VSDRLVPGLALSRGQDPESTDAPLNLKPGANPPSLAARCAAHPERPATGVCTRCGTFACSDCMVFPASVCFSCESRQVVKPRRFGGWLILALLGLFAQQAMLLSRSILFVGYSLDGTLEAAVEQDPEWLALFGIDLLTTAGMAGFALYILPKFWAKRRRVPGLMVWYFGANLLTNVLALVLNAIFDPNQKPAMGAVIFGFVVTSFWISYFQKSDRVKQTFVC